MKLAFAVEQMYSLAKLAYEVECLGDNQENDPILFTVIQHCTRCIHVVLIDTNTQVRNLYECSIWTILFTIRQVQMAAGGDFLCAGSINWVTSAEKHGTERHQFRKLQLCIVL